MKTSIFSLLLVFLFSTAVYAQNYYYYGPYGSYHPYYYGCPAWRPSPKKALPRSKVGEKRPSLERSRQIPASEASLAKQYQRALHDASEVKENEISRNLVAVKKDNDAVIWNEDKTKVLVVTWIAGVPMKMNSSRGITLCATRIMTTWSG
jgi:hypothetical protein